MFAFWKYDGHFGCLGAQGVGDIQSGGRVTPEGYGGMQVQPIVILPDDEGRFVQATLTALEEEMTAEIKRIKTEYRKKANKIAPWLA